MARGGGQAQDPALNRVNETLCKVSISVDTSIPQERPVRPRKLDFFQVGRGDQHLFFRGGSALQNLAVRSGDKRLPPKFDALLIFRFALGVEDDFVAYAIWGADEAAV